MVELNIHTNIYYVYCACGKEAGQFLFGKRPFKVIPNAIEVDRFLYHQEVRHRVRMKLNLSGKYVVGHEVEVETTVKYDMLMNQSLDAIFMGVLSKKLLGTGVAFKMLPFGDRPDVDFGIEVYDEKGTTEWGICLSVQGQLDCPDAGRISHYYLMGRLFTFEPAANQQYSLVITDESLFKKIEQSAVISTISANVTIVLLDLKQMTITKEVHIGPSDIEYISLL